MSASPSPVSPPPEFTIVPPTPQDGVRTTRFIEVVPSTMTLRMLSQRHPPSTPPAPILTSGSAQDPNVVGTTRSNSLRSPLSRRIRHSSLRLSPTQTRSPRDDQFARSPSTSVRSSERSVHPQLPQISTVSPILTPSPLTPPSPPAEGVTVSPSTQEHHKSSAPARGRIPDFGEDADPLSATIASTAVSPALETKHGKLEKQLAEAMEDVLATRAQPGPALNDGRTLGTSRKSTPNRDLDILSQEEDQPKNPNSPEQEPFAHSRKSSHLPSPNPSPSPSPKSKSHRSQRSVSQPLPTTTSPRGAPEKHPNQLFAMQSYDSQRDSASTPKLSYASLNLDPTQFMQSQTPAVSTILPPSVDPSIVGSPENFPARPYHETPTTSILRYASSGDGKVQSPMRPSDTPRAATVEERTGSRVAVSSVTGSPRRSIPHHESPPPQLAPADGDSEDTTTPVVSRVEEKQHTLRRKRGSILNPQGLHDPSSTTMAVSQPFVVVTGDSSLEGNTAMYTSDRTMSGSGISEPAQAILVANPPPMRTLDAVRNQVASEIAFRAVSKSNVVDGVRVGVADASSAWAGPNDVPFIHLISSSLNSSFMLSSTSYLFIITATSFSPPSSDGSSPGLLYITSSSREITSRAVHLTLSKFIGRIAASSYTFSVPNADSERAGDVSLGLATDEKEWMGRIKELHFSSFDSDIIHSILLTASRTPLDPTAPPPNSKSIRIMLEEARAQLTRVSPRQAFTELRNKVMDVPTVLVDIRPQAQREEFGEIPGALIVERNLLEWNFDPRSETRLSVADRYDLRVIVFCQEGNTSSLAALSLQKLGLLNATDVIGGYKAWKEARLPVELKPPHDRSIASAAGSMV